MISKRKGVSVLQRFESKFTKGTEDECWEWTAATRGLGYGGFKESYVTHLAHRLSYQFYVGEIPEGMSVCHTCDNRKCVNPSHLWLGTLTDNNVDRASKGRSARRLGEDNNLTKLTEDNVRDIRELRAGGKPVHKIAEEFNIHRTYASGIINRRYRTEVA